MADYVDAILSLKKGQDYDALIFQPRPPQSDGKPHYGAALGILLRIETEKRITWKFHTLLPIHDVTMPGIGYDGSLSDLLPIIDYHFGRQASICEYVGVKYSDPDFPYHLIPEHLTIRKNSIWQSMCSLFMRLFSS